MYGNDYEFILVEKDKNLKATKAAIVAAMDEASHEVLIGMTTQAVNMLTRMHAAAGHPNISASWYATPPQFEPATFSWNATVLSDMEGKTFYNVSGSTGKVGKQWSYKGEELLNWIEHGVDSHSITGRNGNPLMFDQAVDDNGDFLPNTDFLGTSQTRKGIGVTVLDNLDHDKRLIVINEVNHPGFPGFFFMEATEKLINDTLDHYVDQAGRSVEVKLK